MFGTYNRPYCCRPIVYIVLIATIIINVCIYLLYNVKEVEVVWACDQMRGTLCRKECDCNESTGEKEERKTKRR